MEVILSFTVHQSLGLGDLEDTGIDSDDEMSDEEEEFFGSDWNDLALDDEMASMVLDNLSCS